MKGELLPVEQRHRDAANALRQRQAERIMRAIRDEKAAKVLGDDEGDTALDVQAFANFERDHLSDLTAQLDKAREALRDAREVLEHIEPDGTDFDASVAATLCKVIACLPATSGDVG